MNIEDKSLTALRVSYHGLGRGIAREGIYLEGDYKR